MQKLQYTPDQKFTSFQEFYFLYISQKLCWLFKRYFHVAPKSYVLSIADKSSKFMLVLLQINGNLIRIKNIL